MEKKLKRIQEFVNKEIDRSNVSAIVSVLFITCTGLVMRKVTRLEINV